MKNNDQIVLKSKVRGCLNFTKQKGKVNADSDVDGNLNVSGSAFIPCIIQKKAVTAD